MHPHIISLDRVYDPGCHCAFTDMTVWRGRVWLTFREAVNHSVHPSSQIVVMASADHGRSFTVMARLARRGLDVRDPKFFVVDDMLHIIIPCWEIPQSKDHRLTIAARTDDGIAFEFIDDIPLFDNVTVWRPRQGSDGAWYAAAYDRQNEADTGKVRLFRTANGTAWEDVSVIHDKEFPNETELCFLPDATLLALVRRETSENHRPLLARSQPPYTAWHKMECNRFFQGPLLERMPDGTLAAIGRSPQKIDDPACERKVMRMFILDAETGELDPVMTFASGNDTSYAALVHLPEGSASWNNGDANALISYYSGHEYDNGSYRGGEQRQRAAIYVARVAI